MLAALKQAVANLKAANDSSALTDKNAAAKETAQTPVNPLKLVQVERKLDVADRKIPGSKNQSNSVDPVFGPPPRLNQLQQNEDYYRQEQTRIQTLEDAKAQDAFKSKLRNALYGEPFAKKPIPMDNGVFDLGDAWRNPTYAGGALAKNGARTRGYTDTASDVGAPVRFTGGTMEDKKRKWDDAMARQAVTMNELNKYLGQNYIDLSNLTAEQEDVLDLVKKELTKKSVLGTLTEEEKNKVFNNTLRYLFSHTKSANGDPYPVYIDIISNDYTKQMMPEPGSLKTEGLSDDDAKAIYNYGKHYSADKDQNETYAKQREYKNEVYLEEVEKYNEDLRHGKAEIGDFQEYYDRAMMKIYENCIKPIYFKKDKKGNGIGESIPIGELIPPDRNDLGAQVARTALELIGLPFGYEAGQGNRPKLKIDCQGLVRWALAEFNPEWSDHGIGKGARYQINHTDKVWNLSEGFEIGIGWEPGDLIFWMGEETGEIKHVAIFAGWYNKEPYMIEAFNNGVVVNPVRENTRNNDGEDSFLYQVNRMIPEDLQAYAEGYLSR